MKVTADTNVLLRSAVRDDAKQAAAADALLRQASLIAVPLPCLCEFAWTLERFYGLGRDDVALAIRALMAVPNVVADRQAVDAGLALLEAGGDFADGLIAHEGRRLGADTFVSFDKKAVKRLAASGVPAQLLS